MRAQRTRVYYYEHAPGVVHSASLVIRRSSNKIMLDVRTFNHLGLFTNQYRWVYDPTDPSLNKHPYGRLRKQFYRMRIFLNAVALQEIVRVFKRML